ncbi:TonB-dependent receptor, partial [Flavobacterium psychrophilum]|nr:TonB-dependent receptor [Flavobacterium psychrophilum]
FYRSKYGLFDTNNNQILDVYDDFVKGYFITNVSISKQIKEKFSFQVGANNLLDYTNPKEISNLSGRQIFGKLQFNF